jgi:predicted O-methyltransferase YrrM
MTSKTKTRYDSASGNEPAFTYDWFSHNIPNWKLWLSKFKGKKNLSFLELGCYEGMATRWLLNNILSGINSRIAVVDTFQGSMEHRTLDNRKMLSKFRNNIKHDKRVQIIRSTTEAFLKNTDLSFDFIYIDASHVAKDVMLDALLSWKRLKKNGILIFDDYGWKKYPKSSKYHPKMAVDCFLKMHLGEYTVVGKSYQVCIMKKSAN